MFRIKVITDRFPTNRDLVLREPPSALNNQDISRRLRNIYLDYDNTTQQFQLIIDQPQYNLLVNWTKPMSLVFENYALDPFDLSKFSLPRSPYVYTHPSLGSSKESAHGLQESLSGTEPSAIKKSLKRVNSKADISSKDILNPTDSTSSGIRRSTSLIANAANVYKDISTTIPKVRRIKGLETQSDQQASATLISDWTNSTSSTDSAIATPATDSASSTSARETNTFTATPNTAYPFSALDTSISTSSTNTGISTLIAICCETPSSIKTDWKDATPPLSMKRKTQEPFIMSKEYYTISNTEPQELQKQQIWEQTKKFINTPMRRSFLFWNEWECILH